MGQKNSKFPREATVQTIPRILIGAASSGAGKTTVACGLLQAFKEQGKQVAAFKCGPDYIDPLFHTKIIGTKSRNLDAYFMNEDTVRHLFLKHSRGYEMAVIEGVMGYYDGVGGVTTQASAYDIARITQSPAILILDGSNTALTLAAQVKGFCNLREDSGIKGIIINRLAAKQFSTLLRVFEQETEIPLLGYLPVMEDCHLASRHLGLITAEEIVDLQEKIQKIAAKMKETVDLQTLWQIARMAAKQPLAADGQATLGLEKSQQGTRRDQPKENVPKVRIGVAKDEAFQFYYEDNLELLEKLGAELIFFSPLRDAYPPPLLQGLYLGGGYPELHAQKLTQNHTMREAIRHLIEGGMPCFAECGGFMYLHQTMTDAAGETVPLVGVVPGHCTPQKRLVRFGYAEFTALEDTFFCARQEKIKGHEFHYWDSDCGGASFSAEKPVSKKQWNCIYHRGNLVAGFPHFHFYSNPSFARQFVEACRQWS